MASLASQASWDSIGQSGKSSQLRQYWPIKSVLASEATIGQYQDSNGQSWPVSTKLASLHRVGQSGQSSQS